MRKMQLVRKKRLVVEKQAGELCRQLVTAEFRALFRIDGWIKILLENGKFVQTVMCQKIVEPPCEDLFGEKFWAVVWIVCEEK